MGGNGISFNAGVSAGAFLVGGRPRLSITPRLSLNYRWESGFFASLQDTVFVLPPAFPRDRFGFNNEASGQVGFMFGKTAVLGLGLSLSGYSMVVCKPELCGQVEGVAPGASLRFDLFLPWFPDSVGVGANVSAVYYTGRARVLSDDLAINAAIGPILRFGN